MSIITGVPKIDKLTFEQISAYINQQYGINLTSAKLNLVENRLSKRLKHLKMDSYAQYADHIFSKGGKNELNLLCDYLSTNKTYFYRESAHFDFLQSVLDKAAPFQAYNFWSAACSAGDEVYTLSSLLEEHSKKTPIRYSVLGTDISSRMIDEAIEGKYAAARINMLPTHLINNYFEKTEDDKNQEWFNAQPAIRKNIRFQQFNLIKDIPALAMRFDFIFCRNVLIYFKEETKLKVVNEMIQKLKPGGYLILGHCEGMLCRNTDMIQIRPSVFQKPVA
ncbi:CheR family methyltransferase [Chryseolinea sp. T2]|uniref:CheR family methyltransferase n=1 Tax=Chryseolinea sp. T2 TaxID=3129255 RepID=UPI00307729BB